MKKSLLIRTISLTSFLTLFITVSSMGQWTPDSYYGVPYSDKTPVFVDNFDNNNNDWTTGNGTDDKGYVSGGYFYWESLSTNARVTSKSIDIEESSDYEIEAEIKYISGKDQTGISLVWGKGSDCEYEFAFTGDGISYKVDKYSYITKDRTNFIDFTDNDSYVYGKDINNKLTVRKVGAKWYFFINTNYILTTDAKDFCGSKIGFHVPSQSKIAVNYLKVYSLKRSSSYAGNPKNYSYVSSGDLSNIFYDGFTDNSNDWAVGNRDQDVMEIKNGCLFFEATTTSSMVYSKPMNLNENEDFEIETSIKYVKGKDNNGNGILWGRSGSTKNNYQFCFSGDGHYRIDKYDGEFSPWVDWTSSSNVKKYDYNLFTIRKIDGQYYFFLNKEFVLQHSFESFFDDEIGFKVNGETQIQIDFLRVSKINKQQSASAAGAEEYSKVKSENKEVVFYDGFSDNSHNWPEGDGIEENMSIGGGKMFLKSLNNETGRTKTVDVPLDTKRDFQIESRIKFIKGAETSMIGMVWGKSADCKYDFGYTGKGEKYTIDKYNYNAASGSRYYDYVPFTLKDEVINNAGLYNKLTVRKTGGNYYFYINEILVHTMPFKEFCGDGVGITIPSATEAEMDYIEVAYIDSKSKTAAALVINQQQQGGGGIKVQSQQGANASQGDEVVLPPILSIADISFSKSSLEAGETGILKITVKNTGPGDAKDLYVKLTGAMTGLSFPEKTNMPVIVKNGGSQEVSININGLMDLPTSEANIKVEVIEPNFKVKIQGKQLKFNTHEFRKPEMIAAKFTVLESNSANPNNQVDINEIIDVNVAVQNIGEGTAEDVEVSIINNQTGVMPLGLVQGQNVVRKNAKFPSIAPGKYELISYRFFVNSEFTGEKLQFTIKATEKYNKYGIQENKDVAINTNLVEEGYIRTIAEKTQQLQEKVIIEDIPDFVPDVDNNIPNAVYKNPNAIALIIAIPEYQNKNVPKVQYAKNDANVIRQYLTKTLGYDPKNIFPKDPNELMTLGNIRTYMTERLPAYLRPDGTSDLFIYYAGHGAPNTKNKKAYFVPYDCDPNFVSDANAYKMEDFYQDISKLNARQKYVIVDACFSGQSGSGDMLINNASPIYDESETEVVKDQKTVIFQSSEARQVSNWYPDKHHSMFTYFFLKAIQGAADINKNGEITVGEIKAFINDPNEGMPYISAREFQRPQKAVINGDDNQVMIKIK